MGQTLGLRPAKYSGRTLLWFLRGPGPGYFLSTGNVFLAIRGLHRAQSDTKPSPELTFVARMVH